jgi:hypothetical protein
VGCVDVDLRRAEGSLIRSELSLVLDEGLGRQDELMTVSITRIAQSIVHASLHHHMSLGMAKTVGNFLT